jgi:hypothetical protein
MDGTGYERGWEALCLGCKGSFIFSGSMGLKAMRRLHAKIVPFVLDQEARRG